MAQPASPPAAVDSTITKLHHLAYKCRNAEETRHFYEDILEMPLANVMEVRNLVSTTGELVNFVHLFFQMRDGSFIAFFDLGDGKAAVPDPEAPKFATHVALNIESQERLDLLRARLQDLGVPATEPIDQEGYVRSVYLTDPNGIRLEFTFEIGDGRHSQDPAEHDRISRDILKRWALEHAA